MSNPNQMGNLLKCLELKNSKLKEKKRRLPRKLKKLAKSGQPKHKLSKETINNIAISFWGKIRQYRPVRKGNL